MRRLAIALVFAVVAVFAVAGTTGTAASAKAVKLFAHMTGAQECTPQGQCGVGDPDGTGTAIVFVNVRERTVCWHVTVQNIDTVLAAHIHNAPAGQVAPPLIGFDPPVGSGCATHLSRAVLRGIIGHPENYYVNVHTQAFPAGAVRGQLQRG